MIVQHLKAHRFMSLIDLDLKLPDRGLVVIAGGNGEGKSAILEVASVALYGETLRGTSPWRRQEKGGFAHVKTDGLWAMRTRKASGQSLNFAIGDAEEVRFPTASKAQEALDKAIVPFEVWRRTSVFTQHEAAAFSAATDARRKEILEQILQLGRCDEALKRCRADLSQANNSLASTKHKIDAASAMLAREEESLTGAEASLEEARKASGPPPVAGDLVSIRQQLEEAKRESKGPATEREKALEARAMARAKLRQARDEELRFQSGKCPACKRPVDAAMKKAIAADVAAAKALADEAEAAAEKLVAVLEKQSADIALRIEKANDRINAIKRSAEAVEQGAALRARLSAAVDKSRSAVGRAAKELAEANAMLVERERNVAELQAVERVLGLQGFRSAVLARGLEGLEGVANSALSVLHPEIRLQIRPFSETKAGAIQEKISILVDGAGGGEGYEATSEGERRRINVALILGLSVLGEGTTGQIGDLWFDEVFDGLDDDGISALAELLADMGRERKVVVISHNHRLLEQLRPRAELSLTVEKHEVNVL